MRAARVTAADVLALTASWLPEHADDPFDTLAALRVAHPGFVPTWLSAVATTEALPPALAAELRAWRERLATYRAVLDVVARRLPGVRPVKGFAIADRYPRGVLRAMADVDLVAPGPDAVLRVADVLGDELGTHVSGVFAVEADGVLMLNLRTRPASGLEGPIAVDVSSHATVGDGAAVPPRRAAAAAGGVAEHLVTLVFERLEGEFGPKDVLDAAVLADVATTADLRAARRLARACGVLPELAELTALVTRHGLPLPRTARIGRAAVAAARGRRLAAHAARSARRPGMAALRSLQRAEAMPVRAAAARRAAWRLTDRLLPVAAPCRRSLWQFGVPATVGPGWPGSSLRAAGGQFVLVNAGEVDPRLLRSPAVALHPAPGPRDLRRGLTGPADPEEHAMRGPELAVAVTAPPARQNLSHRTAMTAADRRAR